MKRTCGDRRENKSLPLLIFRMMRLGKQKRNPSIELGSGTCPRESRCGSQHSFWRKELQVFHLQCFPVLALAVPAAAVPEWIPQWKHWRGRHCSSKNRMIDVETLKGKCDMLDPSADEVKVAAVSFSCVTEQAWLQVFPCVCSVVQELGNNWGGWLGLCFSTWVCAYPVCFVQVCRRQISTHRGVLSYLNW